jgi:antitoxin component of MazEF toxin-antitoxin module
MLIKIRECESVHRKGSGNSAAVRKIIPAHVVPMTTASSSAEAKTGVDAGNGLTSSTTSADAMATAAVAAVVATQSFMKVCPSCSLSSAFVCIKNMNVVEY